MSAHSRRQTIAVDFDGVLHGYSSPWVNAHTIPDPPVPGAIPWLHGMVQAFDVYVLSTRCRTWRGRRACRTWLRGHSGPRWNDCELLGRGRIERGLRHVRYSATKEPAIVYVDDRAFRFDGTTWPSVGMLRNLRPWHKTDLGGRGDRMTTDQHEAVEREKRRAWRVGTRQVPVEGALTPEQAAVIRAALAFTGCPPEDSGHALSDLEAACERLRVAEERSLADSLPASESTREIDHCPHREGGEDLR